MCIYIYINCHISSLILPDDCPPAEDWQAAAPVLTGPPCLLQATSLQLI